MAKEYTLALIKPDMTGSDNWRKILKIYENQKNLGVVDSLIIQFTREQAEEFYREHIGKPFFEELVSQMISGPIVALMIFGENAIEEVRKLNGATNPSNAAKGTIRQLFGTPNGGPKNAVHASENVAAAEIELVIFFNLPGC